MPHGEADTRAKLIDPALHSRGWTEDLIRREETAGAIEIIEGKPRKRARGRVDYTLRIKVNPETQPVAIALIEAKAENLPPTHGLEQAKLYAACKRLNVPFVFSSNGHLFVEYERFSCRPQINADNLKHFGEPVFEYDMSQGIEDGYLAACEIHRFDLFLDDQPQNKRVTGVAREDLRGKRLSDADTGATVIPDDARPHYGAPDLDSSLLIPERVAAMTRFLFGQLLATGGPEQKTIIFCARDRHADAVAVAMNNLYADWCRETGKQRLDPYAFKCAASVGGAQYLADLRGATRSHFIATTVDLLTTGVDVPAVCNIVFLKYVRSPVPPEPTIQVEGFDVRVTDAGRYIVTQVDGKAMPVTVEEYKERLAARLVAEAPTLESFRACWIEPPKRREMLGKLPDAGRSALLVQRLEAMNDYDLYDVLAELGYGLAPRTRVERADAFAYKHDR